VTRQGSTATRQASANWSVLAPEEERLRPLYSRVLRLRHVNPGGLLCFVFFEGAVSLAVLLGLAELVSWWAVLLLPASVAGMVKINDEVAGAVVRSAARVPELERARLRRELAPAVGRAAVPEVSTTLALGAANPGAAGAASVAPRQARRRATWLAIVRTRRGVTLALPGIITDRVGRHDEPPGPRIESAEPAGERPEPRWARPGPAPTDRVYAPGRCSLNAHPLERLDPPPPWQWPAGLDRPDSPRQRTRQSGKRRYG
jgi:hypothetical protein